MNERRDRMASLELVCRRCSNPVLTVGVDNLPSTMRRRIGLAAAAELGLQNCLLLVEAVAICIVWSPRIGVRIELDDTVVIAVDVHVQTGTENVLVDMTDHAGCDFLAVFARLAREARCRIDDARGFQFELIEPSVWKYQNRPYS